MVPMSAAAIAAAVVLTGEPAPGAGNPERDAFFGEEHIHTSWSVDAWLMGNRLTGPDDALKYAHWVAALPGYAVGSLGAFWKVAASLERLPPGSSWR